MQQEILRKLFKTGGTLLEQGKLIDAIKAFSSCLTMSEEENDTEAQVIAHLNLGSLNYKIGNIKSSLQHYSKVNDILQASNNKQADNHLQIINNMKNIGVAQGTLGDDSQALVTLHQGLQQCKQRKSSSQPAESNASTTLDASIAAFESEIKHLSEKQQIMYQNRQVQQINQVLQAFPANSPNVAELLKQKMGLSRDELQLIMYCETSGMLLQHNDNFVRESLVILENAVELAEKLKDKNKLTVLINNLGATYDAVGNIEKTKQCMQKSLALAKEIGDWEGEAIALRNLATMLLEKPTLKNITRAKKLTEEAEAISKKNNDMAGVAAAQAKLDRIDDLMESPLPADEADDDDGNDELQQQQQK